MTEDARRPGLITTDESGVGYPSPADFRSAKALHGLLWRNPGQLIDASKRLLQEAGEPIVERLASCPLPLRLSYPIALSDDQIRLLGLHDIEGTPRMEIVRDSMFEMFVYGDKTTGEEHVAVIKSKGSGEDVPMRIHSSCLTAETFHASNCDCSEQLSMALAIAEKEGSGGVIWLHQEGRGNGLAAKAEQLRLMVYQGLNTVEAYEELGLPSEQRDFTAAADILRDLGITSIRLITNNPDKITQTEKLGIPVNGRIPCVIPAYNDMVQRDLDAKRDKHGHMLDQSRT